jgi:septum site-determining protein MinC
MTETRPSLVSIKGIRQGLLFTIADSPSGWEEVRRALLEHIDQQGEFLHGARIALDVGNYVLKAVDLGQLRDALSERELYLWAVMSNSPTTVQTAQTMGLDVRIDKPKSPAHSKEVALQGGEEAAMFHRTLRSGFRLQYAGHVVVIGDVNPGAEIIAGGNIVVWAGWAAWCTPAPAAMKTLWCAPWTCTPPNCASPTRSPSPRSARENPNQRSPASEMARWWPKSGIQKGRSEGKVYARKSGHDYVWQRWGG